MRLSAFVSLMAFAQAVAGLDIHHGTLAVAIIESNQIVIAIDSRVTANRIGQTNSFEDGVEKVIPLAPRMAFFSTGAGIFVTRDATNNLMEIAKELVAVEKIKPARMEDFAHQFRARVENALLRLTVADVHYLHQVAAQSGGASAFHAFIAGQDADGAFRVFRVTCDPIVQTNGGKLDARLLFAVNEEKRAGRQQYLFFGSNKVFGEGLNDPSAPLAPLMKQLRTSQLLAEPAAAALVAAGVREYGDDPKSPVGYPIFVYTLDANGFRMTRKVKKGETVPFDPRDQGK